MPPFDPPFAACAASGNPAGFRTFRAAVCRSASAMGDSPMTELRAPAAMRIAERRQRVHKVDTRWDYIEYDSLMAAARSVGLTRCGYIRAVVLGCPGPRARRSPSIEMEALAQATAELNKVGSNLNQIARILNAAGSVSLGHAAFAALSDTRAAVTQILDIVGRRDRA